MNNLNIVGLNLLGNPLSNVLFVLGTLGLIFGLIMPFLPSTYSWKHLWGPVIQVSLFLLSIGMAVMVLGYMMSKPAAHEQSVSNLVEWADKKYGIDLSKNEAEELVAPIYNTFFGDTTESLEADRAEMNVMMSYGQTETKQGTDLITVRLATGDTDYRLMEVTEEKDLVELKKR